ncbi:MAG: hypothetical protein Q8Q36_02825 [bacterium]|nr:hypothetical protein [bacterium]
MKKAIAVAGAWALPFVAFAQNIQGVLTTFGNILGMLVPILITLAVVVFFWGLIKYLWGDAADKEQAKNIMIWGVIALFVMVAVFGLIQLLSNTFNIRTGGGTNIPQLPVR